MKSRRKFRMGRSPGPGMTVSASPRGTRGGSGSRKSGASRSNTADLFAWGASQPGAADDDTRKIRRKVKVSAPSYPKGPRMLGVQDVGRGNSRFGDFLMLGGDMRVKRRRLDERDTIAKNRTVLVLLVVAAVIYTLFKLNS